MSNQNIFCLRWFSYVFKTYPPIELQPLPLGYCMARRIWKLKTCKNDTSKWSEPAVKLSIYFPPLSNEIIDKHLRVGCHWFHSKAIMVFGWNVVALWNSSKRNKPENLIFIRFSGILRSQGINSFITKIESRFWRKKTYKALK